MKKCNDRTKFIYTETFHEGGKCSSTLSSPAEELWFQQDDRTPVCLESGTVSRGRVKPAVGAAFLARATGPLHPGSIYRKTGPWQYFVWAPITPKPLIHRIMEALKAMVEENRGFLFTQSFLTNSKNKQQTSKQKTLMYKKLKNDGLSRYFSPCKNSLLTREKWPNQNIYSTLLASSCQYRHWLLNYTRQHGFLSSSTRRSCVSEIWEKRYLSVSKLLPIHSTPWQKIHWVPTPSQRLWVIG